MKIVRNPNRWLKKLSRAAALISLITGSQMALAQDGAFQFGRTPSGAVSESIESNRDGFGASFRGGHMAGDTVGRNDSITHINLMPYLNVGDGLLFGDTKLMRANEGGLAWGFGAGYRHYISDWDVVLGGNGYFDRDQLTGAHLKQWGVGAELLAHRWEVRGNIYETFGQTFDLVGQSIAPGSAAYTGNNITFTRVDSFAEALSGFDAEAGFLLPGEWSERLDLRAFGGGYFYEGDNVDGFSGWSSRLQADIGKWLELGVKLTDDERFHTTVMFNATVQIGGFKSQEHTKRAAIQRFRDPVRRNMNIAAINTDIFVGGQVATNPDDGLPFTVAHVNSNDLLGPFVGTVENPFQSLTQGLASPADIVFVHAGSQFNAPPQNIVVLGPNKKLIGEGFIQQGRNVETEIAIGALGQTFQLLLPDSPTFAANQSLTRPVIGNSPGNAVTMGNNTMLSGFVINNPVGNGIFSNGASDTIINDVLIQGAGQSSIFLQNTSGTTTIENTTIIAGPGAGGAAFRVDGGNGQILFSSTDTFQLGSITNTSAQESVLIENMTGGRVDMSNSSVTDTGGLGVVINNNTGGAATIDNVSVTDGIGTGIAILDSAGNYTFRKTSNQLSQITVDNVAQQGILISNMSGTVNFSDDVLVSNRNAEGIEIRQSSGDVIFGSFTTISDLGAGVGTEAALSVHDQLANGSVTFGDSILINGATTRGSLGNGILLTNNDASSDFTVEDNVVITGTDLASININGNDGLVRFRGLTNISQRAQEGILITNSAGAIQFGDAAGDITTILNDLTPASQFAAFDADTNSANISVAGVSIDNAQGNAGLGAGVNLLNNTGAINFGSVDILSVGGIGFFGLNNAEIASTSGIIDSTGAAAVNIENSGIDIQLESVSSTGSPDYGIRLVETNKDGLKTFEVDPNLTNDTPGDGGTIADVNGNLLDDDLEAGVFLQNAGQVRLRSMILDDNEFGIRVRNTESTPGLPDSTKQYLLLENSQVLDSDIRGIDSLNLMDLGIDDTIFDNNGDDAVAGRETILLSYDTRLDPDTIERFEQAEDPFMVLIQDSDFTSNTFDVIRIQQTAPSANGAAIQTELYRNSFTVLDTIDPTGSPDLLDDAFLFDWNGPARVFIENNLFDMTSQNQQQAINFRTRDNEDLTELSIQSNQFNVNNVTQGVGAVEIRVDGPSVMNTSDFQIFGNNFIIDDGAGTVIVGGGRPVAMRFTLAQDAGVNVSFNDILSNADGATGILFERTAAVSSFVINGNRIGLADLGADQETGIRFRQVSGVINIFGNVDNQVFLTQNNGGNGIVEIPFLMPFGSNNGQIIVNGALVP
jgi:hypothetical protein